MELLGKIFGNPQRVKVMRLFLFNPKTAYSIDDVSQRSQIKKDQTKTELNQLEHIGFLKKKNFRQKVTLPKTKKYPQGEVKMVACKGYILNRSFELIDPLRNLVIDTELVSSKDMVKKLKDIGALKLVVLSGLFMRDENRKLDILIVAEKVDAKKLKKAIEQIESEIGKELSYAQFSQEEYEYRISMYDKLLRDILEHNHRILFKKLHE